MNSQNTSERRVIKLLAVVEAESITGPAKNLLEFCKRARQSDSSAPNSLPVETSLVTFARGMGSKVHDFSAPEAGSEAPSNPFVNAARSAGLSLKAIGEEYRYDRRVLDHLRQIVAALQPDIIQTHSVKSHFLMRLSGLWRQYPWVAFHHGYTTPDWKMRAYNQLDRWSLRTVKQAVTVSQAFAQQLERSGVPSKRISVLHNSIDADWIKAVSADDIQACRASLGFKDQERFILAVGRLSHEKSHVDILNALARLRETHPDLNAKFVLLGEGPERARLEQMIAALNLADRVILFGQVRDVRPFYAAAELFLLPSLSEGSPNALLEAMAASLPIVATAVGGIPEIVAHEKSAWLIAPQNPAQLADAIGRLLTDQTLATALATNARNTVVNQYSIQARVRALLEVYQPIVAASQLRRSASPGRVELTELLD